MSCIEVTPAMTDLLAQLRCWPDADIETLRRLPEWRQARDWGWVMESGELTGTGVGHVVVPPRGLLRD